MTGVLHVLEIAAVRRDEMHVLALEIRLAIARKAAGEEQRVICSGRQAVSSEW